MAYDAVGGVIQITDKKKVLAAAYVAAGGKIEQNVNRAPSIDSRECVRDAIETYLKSCAKRQGKSGYAWHRAHRKATNTVLDS